MAAYYHLHNNHDNNNTTHEIVPDDHNANLHTLFLMNPNLPTTTNTLPFEPPPLPHQFVRATDPDNITLYGYPQVETRDTPLARQGLSLTLSSQHPLVSQHDSGGREEDAMVMAANGHVSILGSKYLRPAQELLEEVARVGDHACNNLVLDHSSNKDTATAAADTRDDHGGRGGGAQLSTADRQDIQLKRAKLITMLDEADQRYKQYHSQMQIVVESFERVAGIGSAKTYTALALKTISKQFRCLKDAIQGQIRAANKSLGEEEGGLGSSSGKIEGSRLKFIDHEIRQQRALQQLGMIPNHNAWRPQRGLPERSVSVLRAWLFEHFLHPYPKDSDKITLAKQTGLTRGQVSNWFINARVRLWKPMIEEMYNEELKDQEQNGSEDKDISNEEDAGASISISDQELRNNNSTDQTLVKSSKDHINNNVVNSTSFMSIPSSSPPPYKGNLQRFTLTGSTEMDGLSQGTAKRARNDHEVVNNGEILIKFGDDEKQGRDSVNGYPIISGGMNFVGGGELGSYPTTMGDIGRFETEDFPAPRFLQGNGGISLSLGLPPSCDNHHQQHFTNLSSTAHTFMSPNQNIQFRHGNDFGSMNNPSSHSSAAGFECIDIQNRKGFAAQLLWDFVA